MLSRPLSSANNRQRGVALIMVLGMVAIIAAWAATATYEDLIAIKRISNIQDDVRGTMASESALDLVRLYLKFDAKETTIDSLEEEWAIEMPPFPVDEGMVAVTILDSNRFYNINDLVNDAGEPQPVNIAQLQRLFTIVGLDPSLVNALVDWLDKNETPYGSSGAEDSAYLNKDYKIKNNRLDNWNELKLILGFDSETLLKLKDMVTVRPSLNNGRTLVNINTASAELLMALFPNMTDVDAKEILQSRPFDDLSALQNQHWVNGGDLSRLSVRSDAFSVRTNAGFGRANVREEFLLSRVGQNVQLVWRERLGWQF